MSPVTITTVREWAQTIVLVGTVISSCVVLVFKVGGYTTRLESAIADATRTAATAVAENAEQRAQINALAQAEANRVKRETEEQERWQARRERRSGLPAGRSFDR